MTLSTQCGEKGQWEKALELLGEMRTGGLRPDQNSYRFAMKVMHAFSLFPLTLFLLRVFIVFALVVALLVSMQLVLLLFLLLLLLVMTLQFDIARAMFP